METRYLNNDGSKWVTFTDETCRSKVQATFHTKSGRLVTKTVHWFESFGNFAVLVIEHKGKKRKVFADTILND